MGMAAGARTIMFATLDMWIQIMRCTEEDIGKDLCIKDHPDCADIPMNSATCDEKQKLICGNCQGSTCSRPQWDNCDQANPSHCVGGVCAHSKWLNRNTCTAGLLGHPCEHEGQCKGDLICNLQKARCISGFSGRRLDDP